MSDTDEKNKVEEVKKKGRRPKGGMFSAAIVETAERLSGCLLTDLQIAECLNINIHTFYKWRKENEEFATALIKGRADRMDKLSKLAIDKAETDNNMLTFILKTKGKYIEHNQLETINIKKGELALKEKIFRLSSEKFISELCQTHNLDKDETLDLLKRHLEVPTESEK